LSSAVIDEWTPSTDTQYQLDQGGVAKAVVSAGTKQVLTQDGEGNLAAVTSSSQSMLCTVAYDPNGQTAENTLDRPFQGPGRRLGRREWYTHRS
jgi:hypothetical protein